MNITGIMGYKPRGVAPYEAATAMGIVLFG